MVYFGWILFKFRDLSLVWVTLKGMFGFSGSGFTNFETTSQVMGNLFILIVCILACTTLVEAGRPAHARAFGSLYGGVWGLPGDPDRRAPSFFCCYLTIVLVGNSYNPFLYFQF